MVGDSVYDTSTCTVGDDLIIPTTPPTKYGYHFVGWSTGAELEYIQAQGSQYIDTGIVFDSGSLKFEAMIYWQHTTSVTERDFIGNFNSIVRTGFCAGLGSNHDIAFLYASPVNVHTDSIFDQWIIFTGELHEDKSITLTYNNTTISGLKDKFYNNSNIAIFAGSISKYLPSSTETKVKYIKIWRNNVLVRDFVPQIRHIDNMIGMFDRVTNTFFTNAGTGEFIAGPIAL